MRNSFAQSVLDQINIVDLISENVSLDGNKTKCPFPNHNDANPSFRVYPNTQSFYCWGCKRGGTAIDYIMYLDGVAAGEAIRILCEWANIPLPSWTPEQKAEWKRQKTEWEIISPILLDAFEIYHNEMEEKHWDYYFRRGLSRETIDSEKLGYAPDDDTFLFQRLQGKYAVDDMLKTGMFVKLKGKISDAYQRRYIVPYPYQSEFVYWTQMTRKKSLNCQTGIRANTKSI